MIDAVRIAAVVVGALLAAGPAVVAAIKSAAARSPSRPEPTADAHAILDIAGRLKSAGNARGVELCHQLLEAMFQEPGT